MAISVQSAARYIYTEVLRPRPLRLLTNRLLKTMIPQEFRLGGIRVAPNPNDPVISGALMFRVYERAETNFLLEEIKPGMVVLDIGGNIGYYTAIFASRVGPQGRVLVFEPDPESLLYLRKTISLNAFDNVTVFECAVADRVGRSSLFLSDSNGGDHRLAAVAGAKSIEIDTVSLDSLLTTELQTGVDLIKMDIQGAEALAFAGMTKLLDANRGVRLFMEFWPEGLSATGTSPVGFLERIADGGFEIFNIEEPRGRATRVTDFVTFSNSYIGSDYTNIFCRRTS